jgi:DNA-binding protein HU-beta
MQRNTVVTATLVACLVSGCGGAGDGSPSPSTTSAASSSSSTTPSTTTTTSATPTTSAATTDPALAAALDTLAARARVLKSNDALDALRTSSTAGTAAARKGLKAVRAAAYPIETRSCSRVASGVALTRSGASTATTAGAKMPAVAATRRAQVAALRSAVAAVSKLASSQPVTASPTPVEIGAAVKAATEQAAAETTSLNALVASVADGATTSRAMAATAAEISAKVC